MDALSAIRETFFQECEDQLAELETGLASLEEGAADGEVVNAVFRAVHSIKGGAGAFRLDALVQFAHAFETVLDLLRSRSLDLSPPLLKTLFHAADLLADLVSAAREGTIVSPSRIEPVEAELRRMAQSNGPSAPDDADDGFEPIPFSLDEMAGSPGDPSVRRVVVDFAPNSEMYRKGNEAVRLLRELSRLGKAKIDCDTSALPLLDDLDPNGAYLSWRIELETDAPVSQIEEVFEFVQDDCRLGIEELPVEEAPKENAVSAAPPVPAAPPPPTPDETAEAAAPAARKEALSPTIRVDLERLDRLINLVGELVINQAVLSQRVTEAGFSRSSNVITSLATLEQLTREIQEGVMATRAQPVKPLFQRMTRIVREVAEATGKSVRLKTEGEATEIDRTVIERLADPLTHMIRNAIDHGLEKPEARLAAGKEYQGEVRLSAIHRSGRIIIEVADDGAGIDRARVRQIALEKELIAADAQLSEAEIDNLIFLPGFSTAQTVSSVSGRGVGMDVVKRSIQSLAGRLSIASRPGEGSTFTMSLPLTLAVLDGMIVRVENQTLVVPMTAIVETMRAKDEAVHPLGADAHVLAYRGGFVPLIDVGVVLGFRETPFDPRRGIVLVVETEGSTACALAMDEIFDQRQVVIKSLERNYRQVPGIAAATILGDGRVALILDVDSLVAGARRQAPPTSFGFAAESRAQ